MRKLTQLFKNGYIPKKCFMPHSLSINQRYFFSRLLNYIDSLTQTFAKNQIISQEVRGLSDLNMAPRNLELSKQKQEKVKQMCLNNQQQQYPKTVDSCLINGTIFQKIKMIEDAKNCYLDAIKIDPKLTLAYQHLADIYEDTKNFQETEKYLLKALEITPDDIYLNYRLGFLYQKMGNLKSQRHSLLRVKINKKRQK
ncbi:tetratricopeptide repeat protein (macronuclear) [Tetrahymena thermophila SB210]|uniref:Tetratricopeptide repeat protein n=1 Tax=Tetrahymena thermophila (strain SB210) TaxID=312017 RepID=Q22NT3_TETTS|nr:tetratricopeptide repeat protein [Tetrahymena thermophila SB210]EAR86702.2 tetratricopeptide repeat protein [Tetrahymena thermophila SB210]|eukprot:XP_977297.2 tetratricopeptide repeat protein [Tetrahymena thermophila SB210]